MFTLNFETKLPQFPKESLTFAYTCTCFKMIINACSVQVMLTEKQFSAPFL